MNDKAKFDPKYIIGKCMEMCPTEEIEMRERERLLHFFEVVPGTEKSSLPKADRTRTVKSFSRSAAGKSMQDPNNLRPSDILLKTVKYLLDDVISRKDVQWKIIYDFVMDRLRSVRQDMVIQNISRAHQISILQPIVRFYVYASYRLCEENIYDFDTHINNTHLQECLKRLLCMYDYYDELSKTTGDGRAIFNGFFDENRPYFEALYIIFNLGNTIAITRVLNLSSRWRNAIVDVALEMSLSSLKHNFVRTCRIIELLPPLLASVAYLQIPGMRRDWLKIMSTAYNSKNLCFPVTVLKKLLLFNNEDEVISECIQYGLKVEDGGVFFSKNDFNSENAKVNSHRSVSIDRKLNDLDVSTLILFGE
ncbi:hypothetical protein JTB14_008509 [Gonioctena quinquepunctata]|nr:hypothetical protein JTB14_008509 [Gonioctena quinquepunctata]